MKVGFRKRMFDAIAVMALGLASHASAHAQPVATEGAAANNAVDAQDAGSLRDPAALAALARMGSALAKQMNINVHADITAEDVLMSGQKLQYGGTFDVIAKRPNRLRAQLSMGPEKRELYYDGKSLTLVAANRGMYASSPAPGTIHEMLEMAQSRLGIEIPLADLFLWSERPGFTDNLQSAQAIGKEDIQGQSCEHYAMRQEGVDWQVWIREGVDALPCKLVITKTTDPAMPQFSAVYQWTQKLPKDDKAFIFVPTKQSRKISFKSQGSHN